MAPKSPFEPAREICDESSGEFVRINSTNRQYTRFWCGDEGSGEPVQMCRFARALKSHFSHKWRMGAIYESKSAIYMSSEDSCESAHFHRLA